MNYQFNVKLSEQDYLDYNKFVLINSYYGKKQVKNMRIMILVLMGILIAVCLCLGGFTSENILSIVPMIILTLLLQIFLTKYLSLATKIQIKINKKNGKLGYSPESVTEFYDDCLVDITPYNKTEYKYSAVERVSVVGNKIIYIHINSVLGYILPFSCFESKEQYDEFLEFIKSKCENVEVY